MSEIIDVAMIKVNLQTIPFIDSPQEMIHHMQMAFGRKAGSAAYNSSDFEYDAATKALNLVHSEINETVDALADNDTTEIRDGLADILVTLYGAGLAFRLDLGEADTPTIESRLDSIERLKRLSVEISQHHHFQQLGELAATLETLVGTVYRIGEFEELNVDADLAEVTKSNLSKIAPTIDDAEKSVDAYKAKGVETHIEPCVYGGFIIVSSKRQYNGSEIIDAGKFLKAVTYCPPKFN